MKCKHCQQGTNRPRRGLCPGCYFTRSIRNLYRASTGSKPRCQHCQIRTRQDNGYRGLCRACHQDPRIRNLYPAIYPARGHRSQVGCPAKGKLRGLLDPNPTEALPGTEAKVQVMITRAAAGYSLFHPCDATLDRGAIIPETPRHVAEAV